MKIKDNNNNNDGQRTNFNQKSSLEPSAQVSLNQISTIGELNYYLNKLNFLQPGVLCAKFV